MLVIASRPRNYLNETQTSITLVLSNCIVKLRTRARSLICILGQIGEFTMLNMYAKTLSGREQQAVRYFAFIRTHRFNRNLGGVADFHNHFSLPQLF